MTIIDMAIALPQDEKLIVIAILDFLYFSRYSAREHRIRLLEDFKTSPSLKRYCEQVFREQYQKARALAADETGLPLETFPVDSPFTLAEALNPDYLPEG